MDILDTITAHIADKSRIGASEVPILMGQSSRTVLDLYRKYSGDPARGLAWPRRKKTVKATRCPGKRQDGHLTGQQLERPLSQLLSILMGYRVSMWEELKTTWEPQWILRGGGTGGDDTLIHPSLPLMRATPDGFIYDAEGPALLEIKTSVWCYEKLTESPYYPQIQATLMVSGMDKAYLLEGILDIDAADRGHGIHVTWTEVDSDGRYQAEIARRIEMFMEAVRTQTPPQAEDFCVYIPA
jgi:hypothetical protein